MMWTAAKKQTAEGMRMLNFRFRAAYDKVLGFSCDCAFTVVPALASALCRGAAPPSMAGYIYTHAPDCAVHERGCPGARSSTARPPSAHYVSGHPGEYIADTEQSLRSCPCYAGMHHAIRSLNIAHRGPA